MKVGDPCRVVRLITRLNIGGPAQQALLLTRELASPFPTILATGVPSALEGEMSDPDVAVHRLPLVRPVRPLTDAQAIVQTRQLLVRHRPDIVHTHMAKAGTVGRLAAVSLGRRRPRLVHTFHGHVLDGYFSPRMQRVFVDVERQLARHTDVLIAVSPEVRDDLLSLRIGTADQYRVVPLGLDLGRFNPPATGGGLRKHLGLAAGTPLVGAVGRLVPIKDLGTLLTAVASLPGVHVALLGDGDSRPALEATAASLGVADRAHFLGWYPDIAAAMPDFDVVALTSLNEGTPVAIIEALAAGRPVVATDVGGVSFVVQHGATGLLAPKGDPTAFADGLKQVLGDPVGAAEMAAAGQRDVMVRFSHRRLVTDIAALYAALLDS